MQPSRHRLLYAVLVLVVFAAAGCGGMDGNNTVAVPDPPEQSPTPPPVLPPPDVFTEADHTDPILTPLPTATPRPEQTPAPTRLPFARGWKIKTVIGTSALVLDAGDKQHTIRVGDIVGENLEPVPAEEFDAGVRGLRIVSMDGGQNTVKVRNHDGRITDIHPLGPRR